MGRVTASTTHEIKNILAIIKESSGLLQDIVHLGGSGAAPKAEQIEKVASRIQAQVARGNEQLTSLNWLSHIVSDRGSSVEINEMSSEIVNLMQRFARLKRVELVFQAADRDVTIHTDVAGLLVVLVACIEYYLDRVAPKSRVLLRPGGAGEEVTLAIVAGSTDESGTVTEIEAGGGALPSELANLGPLLGPLGGRLVLADPGEGAELHLILPSGGDADR
jgi:C4-dicarboxylate-specific signal transduction histidine kinase